LQFKWLSLPVNVLSGIAFHAGLGIHSFYKQQYLTEFGLDPGLQNEEFFIEELYSVQKLINYDLSVEWFTEIPGLKEALEKLLHSKIDHHPRFSMKIGANLNRHKISYFNRIQNELMDEYSLKNSLDMNVHRNVTGIFDFLMVYDMYRHPDDNHITREIFGIQAGITLKILF